MSVWVLKTRRNRKLNWLRVLGTAELPHIDQGVCQQFQAKMPLLNVFKTKKHALEFILPRKCPIDTGSQGMNRFVEQPLSSPLRVLSIARILLDIGDHARIENALTVLRRITLPFRHKTLPAVCG
jgi:hypothetical protein